MQKEKRMNEQKEHILDLLKQLKADYEKIKQEALAMKPWYRRFSFLVKLKGIGNQIIEAERFLKRYHGH